MRVYDVVELATAEPPPLRRSVDEIVAGGQRLERRRRRQHRTLAAVAGALAFCALLVPFLLRGDGGGHATGRPVVAGSPQSSPAVDPPFTFTLRAYDAGSYHVAAPSGISVAYQRAWVFQAGTPTGKPIGELVVYRPGAFAAGELPQAVDVGGSLPGAVQSFADNRITLAWQYADDAWATVTTLGSGAGSVPLQDLQLIAAGLAFGPHTVARLPFTMQYVPAGYAAAQVTTRGSDGYGGALFTKSMPAPNFLTGPWDFGVGGIGGFTLDVVPGGQASDALRAQRAGQPPTCTVPASCHSWTSDGQTRINVVGDGRLPDAELRKVLAGVRIAPLDAVGSWPAAVNAVAGSR